MSTVPLSVEVSLPVEGEPVATTCDERPFVVTRVDWWARARLDGSGVLIVSTALSDPDPRYENTSWYDDAERPEWHPAAPEWFWAVVRDMKDALDGPAIEAQLAATDEFARANPGSGVTS